MKVSRFILFEIIVQYEVDDDDDDDDGYYVAYGGIDLHQVVAFNAFDFNESFSMCTAVTMITGDEYLLTVNPREFGKLVQSYKNNVSVIFSAN